MATDVGFRNERTGEIKQVKVGWSWVLFFFSPCLGIPLFLRRLNIWGGVMIALWITDVLATMVISDDDMGTLISYCFSTVFFALAIFFGIKGNELTAKNYLETGWEWVSPEDEAALYAKQKWALV